jgi:hypothetical protein
MFKNLGFVDVENPKTVESLKSKYGDTVCLNEIFILIKDPLVIAEVEKHSAGNVITENMLVVVNGRVFRKSGSGWKLNISSRSIDYCQHCKEAEHDLTRYYSNGVKPAGAVLLKDFTAIRRLNDSGGDYSIDQTDGKTTVYLKLRKRWYQKCLK